MIDQNWFVYLWVTAKKSTNKIKRHCPPKKKRASSLSVQQNNNSLFSYKYSHISHFNLIMIVYYAINIDIVVTIYFCLLIIQIFRVSSLCFAWSLENFYYGILSFNGHAMQTNIETYVLFVYLCVCVWVCVRVCAQALK